MERRRAILDAAEALLREQGYEAATLKAVGERAGIPVASMYHYFPDRHQVDAELLRRHLRVIEELVTAALEGSSLSTLREAADAVIDPLRDYFREHPSCVELWFSGRSEALAVLVREFDAAQADRFWRLLVERGLVSADTPARAAARLRGGQPPLRRRVPAVTGRRRRHDRRSAPHGDRVPQDVRGLT